MVWWTIEKELRLRELVDECLEAQDIASTLSAEFGEVFTVNAVFHKSSRLGLALKGRSPKSYDQSSEDPFSAPSWLERELGKLEEKEDRSRPRKVVCVGWRESPEEITPGMVEAAIEDGYSELWREYVDKIVSLKKCSEEQAQEARKNVPAWFRTWAEVLIIEGWDLGRVPPKVMSKFDKTIEEVSTLEAEGKTEEELREYIEELEATNKAVGEGQRKEAVRRALEEAEK